MRITNITIITGEYVRGGGIKVTNGEMILLLSHSLIPYYILG